MTKMQRIFKLFPLWVSVSAVILLAGIILMALLGFNTAASRPESYVFEVDYNIVVKNDETLKDKLGGICSDAFAAKGLKPVDTQTGSGANTDQDWTVVRYIFTQEIKEETRTGVQSAIETAMNAEEGLKDAEISVVWHTERNVPFGEAEWRGGVAVAVGALVGLIYICIRYGVGSALTGLILAAHDSLFTVSVLAIARIPVYATASVFYAAIAAAVSVLLWLFVCMKLRDIKKDPDMRSLEAADAVEESVRGSIKTIVGVEIALIAVLAILGGVAVAGVRALVLPALIPVAVAAYSSLVLGPSVHVRIKGAFDKLAKKRKKVYSGKKKAQTEE